ncbi:MAG: UDP-N-acetylglucosamine--N-acetylmuramyl-(pentapeptide) pyrophosphoryl-undecaprenol N-acetylglucosamine transferase [Sedimentisphaerales bacterium]|nr:UDP-N-acetylglucosamine--N-acetylmuramyl-(pentapeptide) pyrophosphoryl-undecaprenol N-acetylglucosamine transferase [Sedimentisphaerales bacterium]
MTDQGQFYILAGGGSGGHLYPGIAVAEALREPGSEPEVDVLFLCTERQIDQDILENSGWRYEKQPIVPLPRSVGRVWDFWRRWRASVKLCERLIREKRPTAVLGLGGYASGSAMKVAARMKVPVGMINSDAVPGVANKYCRKFADKIFVQWQESVSYFGKDARKCIVTGCPVRNVFESQAAKNKDNREKVLLIMGGSQGGRNVNRAVVKCLTEVEESGEKNCVGRSLILQGWRITHITGKDDREQVERQYKGAKVAANVIDFTRKLPQLLMGADVVIGRAGASSLAELTAVGVASILLPYPYHRDCHQLRNAEILEKSGAAKIVTDYCDEEKTSRELKNVLSELLTNEDRLESMSRAAQKIGKPDAAARVAEELIKLAVS